MKILFIHPNPEVQNIVDHLFEVKNIEMISSLNEEEAIEQLKLAEFDFIITTSDNYRKSTSVDTTYSFTSKELEVVKDSLWTASGSLKGLRGLFTQGHQNSCFEDSEIFGIGQLLGKISDDISSIEDTLRYGNDSSMENDASEER